MPVQYFNYGWYGYGYGYGYGHYSYYGYGIKNRYQGGGVIVASQRLSRYMTGDGSKYENHLNYHESRIQFEWGATKDPQKPGPLEDTKQRYGVTYLVVFFPDDNPFTPDHDESEDIEVLDTYTWDGKSQKSEIKNFIPKDLIGNKTGIVALLPVELRDINDQADTGDDVTVTPWDTAQPIANQNIAWIDAHTSAQNPSPRMPQLEFRMPGLPQGITIEAKLEVKY